MHRSPELADILATALRGRVPDVGELAEATGRSVPATERDVARLEDLGFLARTEGTITYRRPDATVADMTRGILTTLVHDLEESVAKTQGVLGALPRLLEAWEHGDTDANSLPIDMMRGPWAAADMWRRQTSRTVPRTSYACMPDTTPLYKALREREADSFWAAHTGPDHDIRLLVSTTDANSELGRERIPYELAAGSQVRMHPDLPSFFWVNDHDSVGIPIKWGEAWPTGIMSVRSRTLAEIMTWIYLRVWAEAVPVTYDDHTWEYPWDPILRLMNSGMTMEAAARALGLTARTGRRRVAEAMRHYGASSQFSLGAAWSAAR